MKCPHCGLYVADTPERCPGCDFSIAVVDRAFRQVPERKGFFNDYAGVLDAADAAALETMLADASHSAGSELVVVLIPESTPVRPAEYAFWLFNRWQVGGPTGLGALLLLALRERTIECEEGYAWEPLLSDEESEAILDREAVPRLHDGETREALMHTVRALCAHLAQRRDELDAGGSPQ